MTMVVINKCYGGFGLSPEAILWLYERGCPFIEKHAIDEYFRSGDDGSFGKTASLAKWRKYQEDHEMGIFMRVFSPDEKFVLDFDGSNEARACPLLVKCVEELGDSSFGSYAKLKIVEIPEGVEWTIDEYDGQESIEEKHESWG